MKVHHLLLFLHLAGVIVWMGGMVFAHLCLRPAALELPPAQRLSLWRAVFGRFFPLVAAAVGTILLTGFAMLADVGFAQAPRTWHVMALLGTVMAGVFASIWFGPWPRLRQAVAEESWARGAEALATIRQRVGLNLVLGTLTVAVAILGQAL